MKKIMAVLVLAALLAPIHAQAEEVNGPAVNKEELVLKIKEAKDWQACLDASDKALAQCRTYEDYEKLAGELKDLAARQKDNNFADVLFYAAAMARTEELLYLIRKNDIESGRIYMSVNEKYYNEALENLDKAAQITKSKDLMLDICLLKFSIFKEMFQPQKVDDVFNEMVDKVLSYTGDKAQNIAKLNEISKKISDKGMADYAIKMKFAYASKTDPESAKMLADDIRASADRYLEKGNVKEALSTFDTYIQLAEDYYDQVTMAAKLMDIAEKYFEKKRYKDAIKYYSLYLSKHRTSDVADYASYKLALSYSNDKDYANAVKKFEEFLKTYQNSIWFEKAFEGLIRINYETSDANQAIAYLQKLIDDYPRRDTRDYAYLVMGILYYGRADYDKALDSLKKMQQEFPRSAYFYTAQALISDIDDIKNKSAAPSYTFGIKDGYRMWEAYTAISAAVTAEEGAQAVENKGAKPGEIFVKTKCGSKVIFKLTGLEDLDRFSEYWQDKEDQSRLPREIKTGTEKDLIFFSWSCADNGKFLDDKQAFSRTWQSPDVPGDYVININVGDMALVRPPDSGARRDGTRTLTIYVTAEK